MCTCNCRQVCRLVFDSCFMIYAVRLYAEVWQVGGDVENATVLPACLPAVRLRVLNCEGLCKRETRFMRTK